jgi:hypothetical protein
VCHYSQSFLSGQTHEYGTTLLVLAGLFNLLALVDGLHPAAGDADFRRHRSEGDRAARHRLAAAAYTFVSCALTVFAGS